MTTAEFKGAIVTRLEVPIWSVVCAIVGGIFYIGMTWAQFGALRDSNALMVSELKEIRKIYSTQDSRQAVNEERVNSLERRVTILEGFLTPPTRGARMFPGIQPNK